MEHGKETIIFGAEPGFSAALKNLADVVVILSEAAPTEVADTGKYVPKEESEVYSKPT
jgi:uncharacterized LabA/DUF88 family protein